MVRQRFKKWVEDNIKRFQNEGVTTEYAMPDVDDIESLAKPFIRIIQETNCCIGQVIVYQSNEMEFEVVHIESEELLLWKYFENTDTDFETTLLPYFQTLMSGIKPRSEL